MFNYFLKRLNGKEHHGILSPNALATSQINNSDRTPPIMLALAEPSKSRNPDENNENIWVSHTFLNRSPLITSKYKVKARKHEKFLLVQTKCTFRI